MSFYWKNPDGWFWRENLHADNFHGPYKTKAEAKKARAEFRAKAENKVLVVVVKQ